DRYADLADLAAGELRIGVVAGLRGEVECDGEAGLALGEVLAIELVRALGVGVPGVSPHHPGPIPLRQAVLAHRLNGKCGAHGTAATAPGACSCNLLYASWLRFRTHAHKAHSPGRRWCGTRRRRLGACRPDPGRELHLPGPGRRERVPE